MGYEPYRPPGAPEENADVPWELQEDPRMTGTDLPSVPVIWDVVIEYAGPRDHRLDGGPPTVVEVYGDYATRDEAITAARKFAFEYVPPDPWSEQNRMVYADGREGFLIIIEGATTTWHFTTRVVREL